MSRFFPCDSLILQEPLASWKFLSQISNLPAEIFIHCSFAEFRGSSLADEKAGLWSWGANSHDICPSLWMRSKVTSLHQILHEGIFKSLL